MHIVSFYLQTVLLCVKMLIVCILNSISKKELVDSKELVSDEISGETEKADNKSEAQSTGVGYVLAKISYV